MARGEYDAAASSYRVAVQEMPENLDARSGLLVARERVTQTLLKRAQAQRIAQDANGAEATLRTLLTNEPSNVQAVALLRELERDQRSAAAAVTIRELLARGQSTRALLLLDDALEDDPSSAPLRRLRAQSQVDALRQRGAILRLAESRPMSLDFRDANLRMVLEAITRHAGVNFVVDKDVRADLKTTIFLRQASVEDAIDLICTTNQLGKKILDAQTVLIYPITADKTKEYQDLVIRAFYLSSADPKQLSAMLKSMLKIRDPYVDERLSMIVLRETPETIRLAERLVALLDVSEPEVMMEVEVLELNSNRVAELGIKYPDNITLTPLGIDGSSPAATLAELSGLTRGRIGINTPSVTLNLRREVDEGKLLANPRIRARNREKAKILIGDRLPVFTSTATATGFVSESVQYIDVGLKLEVEPNVYLDDEVAIKVALEVSSREATVRSSGGSTAYQIGTRTANTVLRLRDGETQILAGLINRQDSSNSTRIPGLGDLPILGRLFSSQLDNGSKSEIVLSITPHIIRNVRRADWDQTEFWSGTESYARSRPLRLPDAATSKETGAPGTALPEAASLGDGLVSLPAGKSQSGRTGDGTIRLVGGSDTVVDGEFAIAVEVSAEKSVRGIPFRLAFDKARLHLTAIDEGDFFKQGNEAISFSRNVDVAAGTAQVGMMRNTVTGATGKGTVAVLHFRALSPGDARVAITSAAPMAAGDPVNINIADPVLVRIRPKP